MVRYKSVVRVEVEQRHHKSQQYIGLSKEKMRGKNSRKNTFVIGHLLFIQAYQYLTNYNQRIVPAEICGYSAGATAFLVVLFGVFIISVFPIFSRFHKSSIIMGADVLQRLLVLAVFIAGVVEK